MLCASGPLTTSYHERPAAPAPRGAPARGLRHPSAATRVGTILTRWDLGVHHTKHSSGLTRVDGGPASVMSYGRCARTRTSKASVHRSIEDRPVCVSERSQNTQHARNACAKRGRANWLCAAQGFTRRKQGEDLTHALGSHKREDARGGPRPGSCGRQAAKRCWMASAIRAGRLKVARVRFDTRMRTGGWGLRCGKPEGRAASGQ
jgi:hypothetical protein